MSLRRILVAVDDSAIAAHAVEIGIELARSLHGEIALIHAVDPMLGIGAEGAITPADLIKLAVEDGTRLLGGFRTRATLETAPLEFVPVGKPAPEIVKAAREWPADMIVIGSHGRGGIGRVLLGSVAENVMRHAHCPVVVVRASS